MTSLIVPLRIVVAVFGPCNRSPAKVTVPVQQQDSSLAGYVRQLGFQLERVADRRDGYVAVFASRLQEPGRFVIALSTDHSVRLLIEPIPLGDDDVDSVRWVNLRDRGIDGLFIGFRGEGSPGTVIWTRSGATLKLTFKDGDYNCRAAQLVDVENDGILELLVYENDPTRGDCTSECHEALWERFAVTPAWVQIKRWNGQQWVNENGSQYRNFYDHWAKQYEEIDRWLVSEQDGGSCRRLMTPTGGSVFRGWALRARALAGY